MVAKSKREAIDRYDAKTYYRVAFRLRMVEDAEIIKDMNDAQEQGINHREWLKNIFRVYKENEK